MSEKRKTIMVSGGFDPVHVGHIRMILEASKHGDVIVVANSDNWLFRKKGFVFMEFDQPDFFANGGDRKKHNTPEQSVCEELGVEMLWAVGGADKANSSSKLVKRVFVNGRISER